MTKEELRWKNDYSEFNEATAAFYRKELDPKAYKGISGRFGSYAQRGYEKSMLRLRLSGGRLTKTKLSFISSMIDEYAVDKIHFTTCQAIQLHNLNEKAVTEIAQKALSAGIVTRGGGGDNPRNTMMSPLAGVEEGEYFNVLPYVLATADYALSFLSLPPMPRKLKIAFSSNKNNINHATFRDMGFIAREDGRFDLYTAGGLGGKPLFGVKVAEAIDPASILYYVRAMYETFCTYGDYTNRAKARTRFMQERCGGPENYRKCYLEKLEEVYKMGEDLTLTEEKLASLLEGWDDKAIEKKAAASTPDDTILSSRVVAQKQKGLYAVLYHPAGGTPVDVSVLARLSKAMEKMDCAEGRVTPDEAMYIINLTAEEAREILAITCDSATTVFQTSVACIGASICQQGVRDSQGLLASLLEMEKRNGFQDGTLPAVHISGCPSSCASHQTNLIGFHGGVKLIDKVPVPAFTLHWGGCDTEGKEKMGEALGVLLESEIPTFLEEVGRTVEKEGLSFLAWNEKNPTAFAGIAGKYIK